MESALQQSIGNLNSSLNHLREHPRRTRPTGLDMLAYSPRQLTRHERTQKRAKKALPNDTKRDLYWSMISQPIRTTDPTEDGEDFTVIISDNPEVNNGEEIEDVEYETNDEKVTSHLGMERKNEREQIETIPIDPSSDSSPSSANNGLLFAAVNPPSDPSSSSSSSSSSSERVRVPANGRHGSTNAFNVDSDTFDNLRPHNRDGRRSSRNQIHERPNREEAQETDNNDSDEWKPSPMFDVPLIHSDKDRYCFICERTEDPLQLADNKRYAIFLNIVNEYGNSDPLVYAKRVQDYYNINYRRYQPGKPEWTLRSILDCVEKLPAVLKPKGPKKMLMKTTYNMITTIRDNGTYQTNSKGQTRVDKQASDMLLKFMKFYAILSKDQS